jgi:hypothetical protein
MHSKLISESYKKRLQELAGVLVEDNSGKLKGFGISDDAAKFIVGIDDKLAMFLTNITLFEFAKQEGIKSKNIKEIIPIINQGDYLQFLHNNKEKLNYVLEWIKSPFRQGELNLKDIEDLSQAYEMADAWMKSLEATGFIKDESGDIIKTYPADGMYWIDLKTNNSCAESNAMGHCGRDGKATTLFSLRDKEKSPYVTIGYNENTKTVTQVKGRQNKRPIDKYMKYVFSFLMEMVKSNKLINFEWSYSPHGPDLTSEEINYIFEGNLGVYINSMLERNLKDTIYTPISFSRDEIINATGKEKYSEYINKLLLKNLESPSFRLKLKKGDIITVVGQEKYKEYLNQLINKVIENPAYKISFPKADIVSVVGEDRYNQYVNGILSKVLENPIKHQIDMEKDELFALLGADKYKEFTNNIVKQIVNASKTENTLEYLMGKHKLTMPLDKVKEIVGAKNWFMFLKRSHEAGQSNLHGRLD